ncbi:BON domain-containing protein [Frankia torreyi]|uniref:BON domain-containing protein n=1 Tax=Frankia torreyi TaxID=1856 RepID=UPI0030DBD77A
MTLKEADIPFALGGSYACWARGGPEPVHDVDFMLREEDVPRAVEVLAAAGLRPVDPPEDWLTKVFDGEVLVDLIHHPVGRAVTPEMLERSSEMSVDSVRMPVLDATDWFEMTLLALEERYCDLARVLPMIRAMREQVDWDQVRRSTAASPFAEAALLVATRLNLIPPVDAAPVAARPGEIVASGGGIARSGAARRGGTKGGTAEGGKTEGRAPEGIGLRVGKKEDGREPAGQVDLGGKLDLAEADEYLAGELHERLAEDPRVAELGLEVAVADGCILVEGEVATDDRRRAVADVLAEAVPGRLVRNEVTVIGRATAADGTTKVETIS